jgi:Na+-driven multidrug efflux pump
MRAMMKGVLRGVGIQNSVLPYHILLQGMVLPGVMYGLAFEVCDEPIEGIWIAMSIVDGLLLLAYWGRIVSTDWHEISIKVIKRTNKIAGQLEDEEELLKKPGESELVNA